MMTDPRIPTDDCFGMQRAALAYLMRHEEQYSIDSDHLYHRCVHYMASTLRVPLCQAQKWAHHSWKELHVIRFRRELGIDWGKNSQAEMVFLIDPYTDTRHPIAARLLPSRWLAQRGVSNLQAQQPS